MNILNCFAVLTYDNKNSYYTTPKPAFLVLALLIELEKHKLVEMDEKGRINLCFVSVPISPPLRLLTEIIDKNKLCSVKEIIDFFLRKTTYKDLKSVISAIMNNLCADMSIISRSGEKYIITDEAVREIHGSFILMLTSEAETNEGIIIASLLYGCKLLNNYLDKDEYKSVTALIKNGVIMDEYPITSFIINNIELIHGHIMGIVAN